MAAISLFPHKLEVVHSFFLILQYPNCMSSLPGGDKQRRGTLSLYILVGFLCMFCGQSQREKQNFKAQVGLYTLELSRSLTISGGLATGKIHKNEEGFYDLPI